MDKVILEGFIRQLCNLERYMNAYSYTLSSNIGKDNYNEFYETLCEHIDEYNKKNEHEQK